MVPVSRILRIFFPRNTFLIAPQGDSCVFTVSGVLRVEFLVKLLAKHRLEQGISSVRKHMKEEGENLKRILETRESYNHAVEEAS